MRYLVVWCLSFALLFSGIGATMEIEGRLAVKGIGRHAYLAIEEKNSGRIYKIQNPQDFGLFGSQNEKMKLHIRLIEKEIGPGFPALIRILACYNLSKEKSCQISN